MRRFHSSSSLQLQRPRRRPAVARLDLHVGYWLRYVSKEYSRALGRDLLRKGVSLAEWIVLHKLYEGDRRPATLAEELGLTRGAISKVAGRLATNLMITQESATDDGRGQMLALTSLGRATVQTLVAVVEEVEEDFFGDLGLRTRELIVGAMRQIVRRRGLPAAPVNSSFVDWPPPED